MFTVRQKPRKAVWSVQQRREAECRRDSGRRSGVGEPPGNGAESLAHFAQPTGLGEIRIRGQRRFMVEGAIASVIPQPSADDFSLLGWTAMQQGTVLPMIQ